MTAQMTPEFVLITASGEGRKAQMVVPSSRFMDALAALAAELPDDLAWSARPVADRELEHGT